MLRIYFLQQWFRLSDPGAEDETLCLVPMMGSDMFPDPEALLPKLECRSSRRPALPGVSARVSGRENALGDCRSPSREMAKGLS